MSDVIIRCSNLKYIMITAMYLCPYLGWCWSVDDSMSISTVLLIRLEPDTVFCTQWQVTIAELQRGVVSASSARLPQREGFLWRLWFISMTGGCELSLYMRWVMNDCKLYITYCYTETSWLQSFYAVDCLGLVRPNMNPPTFWWILQWVFLVV